MRRLAGLLVLALLVPATARTQTFEVVGTRAAGMGGAFVGVADDATAVYWNPAGLALGGSYFSLVLDSSRSEAEPDDPRIGGTQSGDIIALSTLPVGLSYYRASNSRLRPSSTAGMSELERLTTHHAGLTVVQSLGQYVAVGSTLKWVHGFAASGLVPSGDRDDLLDGAGELPDHSTNKFDADIGVMALFRTIRAGVTVRNLTEPDFSTAGDGVVTLARQSRAGMSYVGITGLVLAADIDLERNRGALGDVRHLATGAEARLFRRVTLRTGFRFNTLGDELGGHAPVYSVGGSVVTFRSLLVDAQMTLGAREGDRGWGVAARLVY
jgi:hypothetical protein